MSALSEGNDTTACEKEVKDVQEQTKMQAVKRLATLKDLLEEMFPNKPCERSK